jgi:hypothetical protein
LTDNQRRELRIKITNKDEKSPIVAEEAPPVPGSLINSLRAFGYELNTAVADLIDNSITAGANRIDIRFEWSNDQPRISITDDGCGMSKSVLLNAMRLGAINPNEVRAKNDLGRFGLGLKTASFSQAKRLTVATKTKDSDLLVRSWDLDHVEKSNTWQLLYGDSLLSEDEVDRVEHMPHGTIILLDKLDRIFSESAHEKRKKDEFFMLAEHLSDYLGTVFHRFLSGSNKLEIWINPDIPGAKPVAPWDPFHANHDKTQILSDEYLQVRGETVYVQPYILPHQSAFESADAHRQAGGLKGWNAQQGFYVYRNNRLLVSGSWLNTGTRQEEHYKLARISLDISNQLDDIFAIDVRKSQALPPSTIRADLKRIATRVRKQAKEVYGHRGKIVNAPAARKFVPLWEARKKNERIQYRVNKKYPLLEEVKKSLDPAGKVLLSKFLTLVEETIPINKIYFNAVEEPESHYAAFEGERDKELVEIAKVLLEQYKSSHGYSHEEALNLLMIVEPFDQHPYLRETFRQGAGNEC